MVYNVIRAFWRFRPLWIAASAAALIVVSILVLTAQGGSPPEPVLLDGVPADDLARDGIIFIQPDRQAKVSGEFAREVATDRWDGVPARQVVLASMVERNRVPPTERLVWVVNVEPNSIPDSFPRPAWSTTEYKALYGLIFVDADTGEVLGSLVVRDPVP